MPMQKQVIIDCFPESAENYGHGYAIIAVDVIRATTSAITIAKSGGHCFPVPSVEAAFSLSRRLRNPLLAGEIGGELAPGFEINNSPVELSSRDLVARPVILLSSSGTRLICQAKGCYAVYLACFRNYGCVARLIAARHSRVAVIGAGSRGEFRVEDQMCCAWIARDFAEMGYAPANLKTLDLIKHWATLPPEAAASGKSADYLRRSGQIKDLEFVLGHINDLREAYVMQGGKVVVSPSDEIDNFFARNSVRNTITGTSTA